MYILVHETQLQKSEKGCNAKIVFSCSCVSSFYAIGNSYEEERKERFTMKGRCIFMVCLYNFYCTHTSVRAVDF